MRVRFLRDELYEHLGRNLGHLFQAGEKYDFEPAFAERWTRRNLAEEIPGGEKADLVGTAGPFVPLNVVERDPEAPISEAAKRAASAKPKAPKPAGPRPGSKAAKAADAAAAEAAAASKAADSAKAGAPAPAAAAVAAAPAQLPLDPPLPGQAG